MEQPNLNSAVRRKSRARQSIWCLGGLWAGFAVAYIVLYLLRYVLHKSVEPEHEVILLAGCLTVMLIAGILIGNYAEKRWQRAADQQSLAGQLAREALLYLAVNGGLGIAVAVLYHLEQAHHLTNL